jgi:hypothetical protein
VIDQSASTAGGKVRSSGPSSGSRMTRFGVRVEPMESLVRRDGDDLLYGGGGDHCSLLFFWVWLEMAPGEEEAATTPLTAETAVTHWTEATGGTHA